MQEVFVVEFKLFSTHNYTAGLLSGLSLQDVGENTLAKLMYREHPGLSV